MLACMDPRPDYNECVQIETARCDVRAACVGHEKFDNEYKNFDRDTCVAYSKEHCRTREIEGEKWDQKDIDACVKAILSLKQNCDMLLPKGEDETEALGQCNFIENGDAGIYTPKKKTTDTDETPTDSEDSDTSDGSEDAGA